jgi:hypothetical protein
MRYVEEEGEEGEVGEGEGEVYQEKQEKSLVKLNSQKKS